jgi:hypothetical protein
VFDGVLPHISGAGKVFGNTAFAMPGRTATQHEDRFYPEDWFPYGYATLPDPVSGKPGSLLRGDGSDPLIIETNTSTEYWQKGASLVHTDPATGADVAPPPVDWIDPPATLGRTYRTLVSALDADGNEVAGLHLPDIAAPAATFTGTNVYRDYPSELCDRDGTSVPLARTQAEREGKGDPRRSLEERYGARDRYAAAVKSAADSLVAARLLLPEDAARYINAAAASELVP